MVISNIEYSQTFEAQLHDRFDYLARRIGQKASMELLDKFLDGFEARVKTYPESAPLCEEVADFGLTGYHDYVDKKHQLRVIYQADEAKGVIYALLFLSTRQSIRQELLQYCLRKE